MKLTRYATQLAFVAVTSCTPVPATTQVAATGVALTAADNTALVYLALPECPVGRTTGPSGALCANPNVRTEIKSAAQAAFKAYKTAEGSGAASDIALAQSALTTLTTLLATPPIAATPAGGTP